MSAPLAVLVDGEESRSVPVTDRGFLYGDALFEVMRTYDGSPGFFGPHMERMTQGGEGLAFGERCPVAAFATDVRRLITAADQDVLLRLYWTRGDGGGIAGETERTRRVSMAYAIQRPPPEAYRDGVDCLVVGGRATDASGAKVATYVENILATRRARAAGAHEALMADADGLVGEGATSNVFAVVDGVLRTPSLGSILPGVTRQVVLREARDEGLEVVEEALSRDTIRRASELFLTSSVREVLPVRSVDGDRVREPGPITRRLAARYEAAARADASRWSVAASD